MWDWIRVIEVIAIVVIPFFLWWLQRRYEELKEDKKELVKGINQTINTRALALERKLDTCEITIDNIQNLLKHRSEVAQLKYGILKDKIEDLEGYLHRTNGYQVRHNRNTDRTAFTTMTTNDDEVDTQIF